MGKMAAWGVKGAGQIVVGGDWNMTLIFPYIGKLGIVIPIDELIFYRGVETTN